MRVKVWGTRGSLPTPGPGTSRYGGNTCCIEVQACDDSVIVLDAGTGIRELGLDIDSSVKRVDILLSHLHMDHILGLGFFAPLRRADVEVHIWGPCSTTQDMRARLTRYLSPPLFPVRLRDLECDLVLHDAPLASFELPGVQARAALVCHPGPTLGFRLSDGHNDLTYLSDHEPALGVPKFPTDPEWTSGFDLAHDCDLLIHDAQYTDEEYEQHIGWGHSTVSQAVTFFEHSGARRLIAYHHDPTHDDGFIDAIAAGFAGRSDIVFAREGLELELSR